MELYDTDGDKKLSEAERKACPGLEVSLSIYDKDGDGSISQEEIVDRLTLFITQSVALARLSAKVRFNGRPLNDATIRLVPEPYLGDELKTAIGKTRGKGGASVAVPDEELPENQKGIRGIHLGTYKVEITHPSAKIPARYNTETTLGYEATPGNPFVTFELKSR